MDSDITCIPFLHSPLLLCQLRHFSILSLFSLRGVLTTSIVDGDVVKVIEKWGRDAVECNNAHCEKQGHRKAGLFRHLTPTLGKSDLSKFPSFRLK